MTQDGSLPRPATTRGARGTGRSPGRAAAGRRQRLHGHAGRGRPAEGHLLLPGSGPARKCSGGWPGPPTEARSRRPNLWWSPCAAMACRRLAVHQRARPAPRRGEGPGRGANRWWRLLLARRKIRHRHQCHGPGGPPAAAGRRGARHRPHRPDRVVHGRVRRAAHGQQARALPGWPAWSPPAQHCGSRPATAPQAPSTRAWTLPATTCSPAARAGRHAGGSGLRTRRPLHRGQPGVRARSALCGGHLRPLGSPRTVLDRTREPYEVAAPTLYLRRLPPGTSQPRWPVTAWACPTCPDGSWRRRGPLPR